MKEVFTEIATEKIMDSKTLVEQAAELRVKQKQCMRRLEQSQKTKEYHKAKLRTWHRLKGALEHVSQFPTANLLEADATNDGEASTESPGQQSGSTSRSEVQVAPLAAVPRCILRGEGRAPAFGFLSLPPSPLRSGPDLAGHAVGRRVLCRAGAGGCD